MSQQSWFWVGKLHSPTANYCVISKFMNTISHEACTDTHPHKYVKMPTQLLWEGGKEVGGGND